MTAGRPPVGQGGSRCASDRCRAPLRWVKTVDHHPIALDIDRVPDGSVVAEQVRGQWRARLLSPGEQVHPQRPRYAPHWGSCPDMHLWDAQRRAADPMGHGLTRPQPGVRGPQTWRCAGCYWPYHVVRSSTLCEVCRPILHAWRDRPGEGRGPIPYPRWNPATGRRDPYEAAPSGEPACSPPTATPRTVLAVDGR